VNGIYDTKCAPDGIEYPLNYMRDIITDSSAVVLYKDGQWAEIIETKLPKIAGYKGEITERHIKYGCTSISKKTLKQMERVGIINLHLKTEGKSIYIDKDRLSEIYKAAQ